VASTTTGSFGEYNFRYLPTGDYTVESLGGSHAFTLTEAGQFLSSQNIALPMPVESTKFYVVNDAGSDRTYQYGATGSANANTALAAGNTAPRGAASNQEGTKLWVVDANKTVYVYNAGGALLGSWSASGLPKNSEVQGIATNGTDIWVLTASSKSGDRVFKYAGAAGRLSGSQKAASNFALSLANPNPTGIVTDGTSFWIVDDSTTDRVFKYTLSGSLLGSWTIDSANSSPTGITINPNDVSDLWIVDNSVLQVFQYRDSTSRTSGSQMADRTFALAPGNTNPQGIADPPSPEAFLSGDLLPEDVSNPRAHLHHDDSDAAAWGWLVDAAGHGQNELTTPSQGDERRPDPFTVLGHEPSRVGSYADDEEGAGEFLTGDEDLTHGEGYAGEEAWIVPLLEVDGTSDPWARKW
jgi:hypothetical protein